MLYIVCTRARAVEEREETRKIQFTGKSSYIVSLPKRWVTDLGLRQGDQLVMQRRGAAGLHVTPVKHRASARHKDDAYVEISPDEQIQTVVRKLISLYFLGFRMIHVVPRGGRLGPQQRAAVKGSVKRMLMGSEIISDSSAGITVQVLVNLMELSVEGALKRMLHLARTMLADAMLSVKESNADLAEEVVNTDDEVDRFGFYIIRQIKIAVQNEHMMEEMGLRDARHCLGYRIVAKSIERAADHAALIARDLIEFGEGVRPDALAALQKMSAFSIEVLDEACLALFKEDYVQAERTILRCLEISRHEKRVADLRARDEETVFRARRMSGNLRRISEYASDIAEIAINLNIEKALLKGGRPPR